MIKGLLRVKPTMVFNDERGSIAELFNGQNIKTVKHTITKPGVLRGVHIQDADKIVYPATGKVFSLMVDMRKDSSTYGEVFTFVDGYTPRTAYFIPKGVGFGYCVLGDEMSDYFYFGLENFDQSKVGRISYKHFKFPLENPIVSQEDAKAPMLADLA